MSEQRFAPKETWSGMADDPSYRPTRYSLSNSEVESTGILCGGAILNIARELIESRKIIANLRAELRDEAANR